MHFVDLSLLVDYYEKKGLCCSCWLSSVSIDREHFEREVADLFNDSIRGHQQLFCLRQRTGKKIGRGYLKNTKKEKINKSYFIACQLEKYTVHTMDSCDA